MSRGWEIGTAVIVLVAVVNGVPLVAFLRWYWRTRGES